MGRASSVSRRRTRAERTRLSVPLYVSITRPTGQLLRGVVYLLLTLSRSLGHSFRVDAILCAVSGSGDTPRSIASKIRLPDIGLGAISFRNAGHFH